LLEFEKQLWYSSLVREVYGLFVSKLTAENLLIGFRKHKWHAWTACAKRQTLLWHWSIQEMMYNYTAKLTGILSRSYI